MSESHEDIQTDSVSLLDESYLHLWEESIGGKMMSHFVSDLVTTFEESYAKHASEIATACQQQDDAALIQLLHYMKGSLGNLGLQRAAAYARQAEIELRTGEFNRHAEFPAKLDFYKIQSLKALYARYP